MPSDPNWFYSSLAQSAASIVGLIGAILATRLQQQIIDARGKKKPVELSCEDFFKGFNEFLILLREYEKHSESQVKELEESINHGEEKFGPNLWYSPIEEPSEQKNDLIREMLKIEQVYYKAAPILLRAFNDLEYENSISALKVFEKKLGRFHTNITVEAEELEKIKKMMSTVDSLREKAKKLLDENDFLKRSTSPAIGWILWIILFVISISGVVWPLFTLKIDNRSHGWAMWSLFTVGLFGLLLYIGIQIRTLKKIPLVKLILTKEQRNNCASAQENSRSNKPLSL